MSFKQVILIGGGGHASVLVDLIRLRSLKLIGISARSKDEIIEDLQGFYFIGNDDLVLKYFPHEVSLINGVGSTQDTRLRRKIFRSFKSRGYEFTSLVHPSAIIADNVQMGEGVQVMAGAVIQSGSTIGENTIINTKASVDHHCKIGAHVHLAPGVTLSGGVKVESGAHIGTGSVVIENIIIGKECLVAAGAVVIRTVPERYQAMGVPAFLQPRQDIEELL